MSALKIIIEGGNLSGKSSIVEELEKEFVHSVAVALHGYYHPKYLEKIRTKSGAKKYHSDRLKSFLPMIGKVSAEELIFNRFHLTASVYLKIFYGLEESFFDIEEELNKLGIYLVLADFDNKALEERLKKRIAERKEAPYGDGNFSKVKEKRDLYRYFFEKSRIERKYLIDTSAITPVEAVKKFKKETNSFKI
jgi:thymidylate kinase